MKKKKLTTLLITLLFITLVSAAHAVTWTVANQSTIAWDAVTKMGGGTDIPPGDTITYEVYIVKDGEDKASAVKVGDTNETTFTITFNAEGKWIVGVKSIRTPEAAPENKTESTITWSDTVDITVVPVPFGFIFFEAPANPGGLTPQ